MDAPTCFSFFLKTKNIFGWMLHRGATSGLDWYWIGVVLDGYLNLCNVGCWNWNYTIVYYIGIAGLQIVVMELQSVFIRIAKIVLHEICNEMVGKEL